MQVIPMDKFKLKWRWMDENYRLFPEEVLSRIFPLDGPSSKKVWEKSLTFIDKGTEFSPNSELFDSIETIDTTESSEVVNWLMSKMPSGEIVISWQPDTAVKTTTSIFIKYWDEFCYPSCDDVSIWSESESWVIHFWHYEKACYGKAKDF